ncbi:MAG: nuclear transport factor 2 family protein [Paracoccaceae bacterium]
MDGAAQPVLDAVHAAAVTYCVAVYKAQAEVFETLCHDDFHMVCVDGPDTQLWDKTAYLARVTARDAAEGDPVYEILSVEADGAMARVKLRVGVPGVVYEDYLGFVRVGDDWKLINKLFRTYEGPAAG